MLTSKITSESSVFISLRSLSVEIFETSGKSSFTASVVTFIAILKSVASWEENIVLRLSRIKLSISTRMSDCLRQLLIISLIYGTASSSNRDTTAGVCKNKGCSKEQTSQPSLHLDKKRVSQAAQRFGMEWRSHGKDNNDLVSQLSRNDILKTQRVIEAMRKVDRGNYCNYSPYMDAPQSIGYGVTISAPHMHAHALEILKDNLFEGAKALDVGSGKEKG